MSIIFDAGCISYGSIDILIEVDYAKMQTDAALQGEKRSWKSTDT